MNMKPTPLLLSLVPLVCISFAAAQPAPSDQGWGQAQKRDAADTYTFTHFTLIGRFANSAALADRPALTVDCIPRSSSGRAKFLAADLLVGKTLKIDWVEPQEIHGTNYFPKVAVEYRLDGAGGEQQQWSAGTDRVPTAKPSDKDSASVPKDALKKFLRAHTVVITAADEQGAPLEMRFDIADPAAIKASCNVD
jgi:hypothetical protein